MMQDVPEVEYDELQYSPIIPHVKYWNIERSERFTATSLDEAIEDHIRWSKDALIPSGRLIYGKVRFVGVRPAPYTAAEVESAAIQALDAARLVLHEEHFEEEEDDASDRDVHLADARAFVNAMVSRMGSYFTQEIVACNIDLARWCYRHDMFTTEDSLPPLELLPFFDGIANSDPRTRFEIADRGYNVFPPANNPIFIPTELARSFQVAK